MMASNTNNIDGLNDSLNSVQISDEPKSTVLPVNAADAAGNSLNITCFSDVVNDVTLHFQIIRFQKQIYAWIGCNSSKLGHLYAAAATRPNNAVSVTSILGGGSDNTGSGIARRLVLKTGHHIILACNIPKNSPMLEADAEKILIQKLISLGYTKPKHEDYPNDGEQVFSQLKCLSKKFPLQESHLLLIAYST